MKRRWRFGFMGLVGLSLLGLSGCSLNATDAGKTSKVAFAKTATNKKPQVWYAVETDDGNSDDDSSNPARLPGKNSSINAVVVTQNDRYTVYNTENSITGYTSLDMSDVVGKSPSQVIKLAKKADRVQFKYGFDGATKYSYDQNFEDGTSASKVREVHFNRLLDKAGSVAAQHYTAPKSYPIKVKTSNGTQGNGVTMELPELNKRQTSFIMSGDNVIHRDSPTKFVPKVQNENAVDENNTGYKRLQLMSTPVEIRDHYFIGFASCNTHSNMIDALITPTTNKKAQMVFDNTKTKGVN